MVVRIDTACIIRYFHHVLIHSAKLLHTRLPSCLSVLLREHCCTPPIDFKPLTIILIGFASMVRIRHISASHRSYHSFHKLSTLRMSRLCASASDTPPLAPLPIYDPILACNARQYSVVFPRSSRSMNIISFSFMVINYVRFSTPPPIWLRVGAMPASSYTLY